MKHLLLSAALLLALAGRAQSANPAVWCPPGATWTYDWRWFAANGTITMSYARDTVVAGQLAQLLTRVLLAKSGSVPDEVATADRLPSVVTRVVDSRVEVLGSDGAFYTLYDFAAPPGSSWLTPQVLPHSSCPGDLARVVVDSTGTHQVAGRPLRWFRAHLASPTGAAGQSDWYGRIYEQLGNTRYAQPQSPTCGGIDPDYIFGIINYRATGQPMLSINQATGQLLATAAARATAAGFAAYPNPSHGPLTLTIPAATAPAATLRLLDLAGRAVRQLPLPAGRQLNVSGLPAGTYTLLLESAGQATLAHRLVVE